MLRALQAGACQVLRTNPQRTQVQDHYRQLAADYGARANQTCERTYCRLVQRFLTGRRRVLELGSGSSDLLDRLGSPLAVACDLSVDMLGMRRRTETHCVAAAGEKLPFSDGLFDGLFHINMLEHVADVDAVVGECARVLQPEGLWLTVTPNGNWEYWLDLAEKWKLKIPEGPHSFLTTRQLRQAVEGPFEVVEHATFLILPAGPPRLAHWFDRLTFCSALGWGFFQYLAARRKSVQTVANGISRARQQGD